MFIRRSLSVSLFKTVNSTNYTLSTTRINLTLNSKRCLSFWSATPTSTTAPTAPTLLSDTTTTNTTTALDNTPLLTDSLPRFDQSTIQTHIIDGSLFNDQPQQLLSTTLAPLKQTSLDHITEIGDFKLLGLSNNTLPGLVERLVESVYVMTGLPWYATIITSTLLIRLLFVYPAIVAQKNAAIMAKIKPDTDKLTEDYKQAQKNGNMELAKVKHTAMFALWKKNGAHPFKSLIGLIQAPVFFAMFYCSKKMGELPIPGFETGGPEFLLNLSAAPPIYLPILASTTMLIVFEVASRKGGMGNMISSSIKNFIRGAALMSIVFTRHLPTVIFMYMITSNLFTLCQTLLFAKFKIVPQVAIVGPVIANRSTAGVYKYEKLGIADAFQSIQRLKKKLALERKA